MDDDKNRTRRYVLGVKKIAVLRANVLGDFIFTLPALIALKKTYPDAELVLLGLSWHEEFLRGRPGPVDRVIVIPPYQGVRDDEPESEEELRRFFATMAREHFDIALQLYGGGRYSNPFILALGARLSVGTKTPDAVPLDRWIPYVFFQSETYRWLEVVSLVGAALATDRAVPSIAVTADDIAESETLVPRGNSLVVLQPGASDPRRRYPPSGFAAVGDALARRGYRIVINGIPSERNLADAVARAMQEHAENVCGKLSRGGLLGLLSRSRLLVSNDTGPMHCAIACGAPSVGIYWCVNLLNASPFTRAFHRPIVSWVVACPQCGAPLMDDRGEVVKPGCGHEVSYVARIPVDTIIQAALDLLSGRMPQAPRTDDCRTASLRGE